MNKIVFSQMGENIFLDDTHKKSNNPQNNKSSAKNAGEMNSSINNYNNCICQNISLNVNQNKKNSASFALNIINKQKNNNNFDNNNYTQHIILHSLNALKNSKSIPNNENENENRNKGIQHIILKSLKKYKNDKLNNDKNQNENYNNIMFNKTNIIRVIVSSEKIIKNFPSEYLNEMICDICSNLYESQYNLEKIQLKQSHFFKNYQNFFEIRKSLFNLIIQLCMNTEISESTLFLTYNIFDRYISIEPTNNDELLLIIITCFSLAIKYTETSVPNLDELCVILGKKFNKEDIGKCELIIMEKLNYNISIPTIFDLFQFIKVLKNLNQKEYYLGLFILEMVVIGCVFLKYNPLCVVEAIYLLILETFNKEKWNLNLYNYMINSNINKIKYNEEINFCLANIKEECLHIKDKNFYHLIKKFSNDKYCKISVDFQLI